MPAACTSERAGPAAELVTELWDEVEHLLQPLKDERDMWKARAEAYKAAFEAQTGRLHEAIDLYMRATHSARSSGSLDAGIQVEWQSNPATQGTFGHVEQLVNRADFHTARREIDRILPGRLSSEARIEGLLLKSAICRASGPEWVLDGLAQCSEALTLCNDISGLEYLLPKIHYHRGLCLFLLRELEQARDAFADVGPSDPLHERAALYGQSCQDDLEATGFAKRRSAFDERRTFSEAFFSRLKDSEGGVTRGRLSATRTRFFPASKPTRRSLPTRWMSKPLA